MLYVTTAFGVPVNVIVALEFAQIVVGATFTVAVGNGKTFNVTLLDALFTQLGVPVVATLTILIVAFAANVLDIVAVPVPLKVMV